MHPNQNKKDKIKKLERDMIYGRYFDIRNYFFVWNYDRKFSECMYFSDTKKGKYCHRKISLHELQ